MPKWKAGSLANIEEPEAAKGFASYDGPDLPFTGVFPFKVKIMRMKVNGNGDDMINGLLEVHAPKKTDPKHRWHGAPMWFNQNVTEQGGPYLRAMLDGFGVSWKAFLSKTVLDEEDPPNIIKLGGVKMEGAMVKCALKGSKPTKEYPKKAEPASWIAWDGKANDDPDADDPDDEGGDFEPDEPDDAAPF